MDDMIFDEGFHEDEDVIALKNISKILQDPRLNKSTKCYIDFFYRVINQNVETRRPTSVSK